MGLFSPGDAVIVVRRRMNRNYGPSCGRTSLASTRLDSPRLATLYLIARSKPPTASQPVNYAAGRSRGYATPVALATGQFAATVRVGVGVRGRLSASTAKGLFLTIIIHRKLGQPTIVVEYGRRRKWVGPNCCRHCHQHKTRINVSG